MSADTDGFGWWWHPRTARLLITAVLIVAFLYAGFTADPLAIRAVNLVFALFILGYGGLILSRSAFGVSRRTAGGACLAVGGAALTITSIAGPLDGVFVFGDTPTVLTDVGFVFAFAGGVLYYWSSR